MTNISGTNSYKSVFFFFFFFKKNYRELNYLIIWRILIRRFKYFNYKFLCIEKMYTLLNKEQNSIINYLLYLKK